MKETQHISESEKEQVSKELWERYDPVTIGQINKLPPFNHYFVTLYFEDLNFTAKCHFNISIEESVYDFTISNMAKVENETNVTIRITKQ